jgi:N6-L-threonylcarbamoyladenine synthase
VRILGIETSCDDTSAAVVVDGVVRSNVVSSQDEIHAGYGGVVPELAARRHLEAIQGVVNLAMERAGIRYQELDLIAVTRGPGLIGSLLVGVAAAQGLACRLGIPLDGVNHLEGHVLSPLVEHEVVPPFLALLVSGGHTALYLVRGVGEYAELATTRDDSAGEAFDKAAKMLGLGFPGGRAIDRLARDGRPDAVRFPRARVRDDPMALSFSGLKTALWDHLRSTEQRHVVADLCASFQEAIVDVLVDRCVRAMNALDVRRIVVAGGVAANSRLRARMSEAVNDCSASVVFPSMALCTDNAAMIATVADRRRGAGLTQTDVRVASRLPIGRKMSLP